jgi:hypothetical protein
MQTPSIVNPSRDSVCRKSETASDFPLSPLKQAYLSANSMLQDVSWKLIATQVFNKLFFLIRFVGGGVQLGPLGTEATDWPIVACPG